MHTTDIKAKHTSQIAQQRKQTQCNCFDATKLDLTSLTSPLLSFPLPSVSFPFPFLSVPSASPASRSLRLFPFPSSPLFPPFPLCSASFSCSLWFLQWCSWTRSQFAVGSACMLMYPLLARHWRWSWRDEFHLIVHLCCRCQDGGCPLLPRFWAGAVTTP